MKLEIFTEIKIKATPEKVWKILSDFNAYPEWNPFIKSVEGNVDIGNTIKIRIEPPNSNGMNFKPKVLSFIKNQELSWLGNFLFPGLFDGKHMFKLISNPEGTTTFIQSEQFSGVLVPLLKKQLNKDTKRGFILMNEKLKEIAENNCDVLK